MLCSVESSFEFAFLHVSIVILETQSMVVPGRTLHIFCCSYTLCTETKFGETPCSSWSLCSLYRCGSWCIVGTNCGICMWLISTSTERQGTFPCRVFCCIWSISAELSERHISYRAVCPGPWTDGRRSDACIRCTFRKSCSGCGKPCRGLSVSG